MSRKQTGNKHAQNKRRQKRLKNLPPKQKDAYELIDGNYTYYPAAYCSRHKRHLSLGLMETHKCKNIHCCRLKPFKPRT